MKNKTILVDIDCILWDFHKIMCKKQKEKYGVSYYNFVDTVHWDSWDSFLTKDEFFGMCNEIHMSQHLYEPFPESENFLKELKNLGFYVIIASSREKKSKESTKMFLRNNNLVHDELHLTFDKEYLFNRIKYIVDDRPETLRQAREKGLVATSIKYDWNKHLGNIIPLFNNLDEILNYIKNLNGNKL